MRLVFDTYAWVEYFEGSPQGKKVNDFLENRDITAITPSIVLAELSDSHHRGRVRTSWAEIVKFITLNTHLQDITPEIAFQAGKIKNELRKKQPAFGIIDGAVYATALLLHGHLVTGDHHLTKEKEVIDITL